ncbi:MAG: flagellar basal body L-ring protein FlgH [Desulfobacteraceae bacterium]|nr:MAG: flagellar basal body L-ring protein FlgH [Desulfobacteraceae bacterium]
MKPKLLSAEGKTRIKGFLGVFVLGLVLGGCAGRNTPPAPAPAFLPVQIAAAKPAEGFRSDRNGPTDGSLFDERAVLGELFINLKARRIGDIVTIRIVENSSASNQASTTTDRSSSLTAGIEGFFNAEKRYANDHPFFNPFSSVKGAINSEFEGTGATKRSGALSAYMTARVMDILPNGNLVIEGNREVRVNAENQQITLTGIIRPRDISADNIIQSTYIADARIAYSGKGVINERQRPGWFTRVLDVVWPF